MPLFGPVRKFVSASLTNGVLVAVCDDGTLWMRNANNDGRWELVENVHQNPMSGQKGYGKRTVLDDENEY